MVHQPPSGARDLLPLDVAQKISISLTLQSSSKINSDIKIETYQDHRMAMAFAPLALKTNIIIEDAEVVSKSFPTFWDDLKSIGFNISEI